MNAKFAQLKTQLSAEITTPGSIQINSKGLHRVIATHYADTRHQIAMDVANERNVDPTMINGVGS